MSLSRPKLKQPPIIEAIIDIECDYPPETELITLEARCREAFTPYYPKQRTQLLQHHSIEAKQNTPARVLTKHEVQAFQFLAEDEKQLVQVRNNGYTFNRLAPYTTLDDYLPEIERTWGLFRKLTTPNQVRVVRLRYINRLVLPGEGSSFNIAHYFRSVSDLPNREALSPIGFFNQYIAEETATGNEAQIIIASEPRTRNTYPTLLDITTAQTRRIEADAWDDIAATISSLRRLKNSIFYDTITEQCLTLFQ